MSTIVVDPVALESAAAALASMTTGLQAMSRQLRGPLAQPVGDPSLDDALTRLAARAVLCADRLAVRAEQRAHLLRAAAAQYQHVDGSVGHRMGVDTPGDAAAA